MKVDCPLKEKLSCEPDRLTGAELLLCRSCWIARMLLFRRNDDHANGPGMGLLQRDAPYLETPDLTMEGRPFTMPVPPIGAAPSCLNLQMREPAFELADVLLEGSY